MEPKQHRETKKSRLKVRMHNSPTRKEDKLDAILLHDRSEAWFQNSAAGQWRLAEARAQMFVARCSGSLLKILR
jgi:hypothetical protein